MQSHVKCTGVVRVQKEKVAFEDGGRDIGRYSSDGREQDVLSPRVDRRLCDFFKEALIFIITKAWYLLKKIMFCILSIIRLLCKTSSRRCNAVHQTSPKTA